LSQETSYLRPNTGGAVSYAYRRRAIDNFQFRLGNLAVGAHHAHILAAFGTGAEMNLGNLQVFCEETIFKVPHEPVELQVVVAKPVFRR
jgi:hypothetical protein